MRILITGLLISFSIIAGCGQSAPEIDGELKDGLRIITVSNLKKDFKIKVYRGDYIVIRTAESPKTDIVIPDLDIKRIFPVVSNEQPYLKMGKTGNFTITLNGVNGIISVIDYREPHYRELSAREAAALISNTAPLILDVRTQGEYSQSHIKGSTLIPVQILYQKISEGALSDHKDQPILVYCATGNRSTVAAKMLIDSGFKNIYNMRYGIAEWKGAGLPVE